jgi:hypothetical protein
MAQRNKPSAAFIPNDLGFHALVFDEHDVVRLLRAAVEQEGGQSAFAKHHGVARAYLNMVLNGKRAVGDSIAGVIGLRKVYIAQ